MSCEIFHESCLNFSDNRSRIVVTDKGTGRNRYVGNNAEGKTFCLYRVDDCLLQSGRKCDYLLLGNSEKRAYFIELKGSDLIQAVRQINTALDELQDDLIEFTWSGRIILTRVNTSDLVNSEYIKLRNRLVQRGGTLRQQTRELEENL